MEPTICSGDLLVAKRLNISRNLSLQNSKIKNILSRLIIPTANNTINSNDIVILNQPYKYKSRIVKRCVGMPGDIVCIKSMDSISVRNNDVLTLYTPNFPLEKTNNWKNTYYSNLYNEEIENDSINARKIRIPSNGYRIQLKKSCYYNYKEIFNRYTHIEYDKESNKFYKNGILVSR